MKDKRIVLTATMLLSILLTTVISPFAFAAIHPDLDSDKLSANGHFRIYYTTDCVNHPDMCIADVNVVDELGEDLENVYYTYTDPGDDFQFTDPFDAEEYAIQITAIGSASTDYAERRITFGAGIFSMADRAKQVLRLSLHELLVSSAWQIGQNKS
jgi:hypothetical protein